MRYKADTKAGETTLLGNELQTSEGGSWQWIDC